MNDIADVFVDTNVFMRLFDISDITQSEKARALFENASADKVRLVVGPPVFFELAWVLQGALERSKSEVLDIMEAIISWKGLKILDKELVERAVSLARDTNQGFADAYIAANAEKSGFQVATFNKKHFAKLGAELYPL